MNKKMNHKKLTLIISVIISIIIVLVAIFYFPDIQSEHAQEYELFTKIDNSSVEVIAPTTTATSISTATKKTTMTTRDILHQVEVLVVMLLQQQMQIK